MVWDTLTDFEHSVDLVVAVFCYDLERSKQLCCQQLALLGSSEVLQRHEDSCWLPRSVAVWNRVFLKRSTAE